MKTEIKRIKESKKGQQHKGFLLSHILNQHLLMECNKIKCKCGSNKFLNKRQTINTYKIKQAPKKPSMYKTKAKEDVRRKQGRR